MGLVKLVERISDKKLFAAKINISPNQADYERAEAELRILQKLDHANIVKLEESFGSWKKK